MVAVGKPPTLPVHVSGQYRKNTVLAVLQAERPDLGTLLPVHRLGAHSCMYDNAYCHTQGAHRHACMYARAPLAFWGLHWLHVAYTCWHAQQPFTCMRICMPILLGVHTGLRANNMHG